MLFCPFISFILKGDKRQGVPSNRIKRQEEERNRKPVTFVNCSLLTALRATDSEGEDAEERGQLQRASAGGGGGGQKGAARAQRAARDPFFQSFPAYSKVRLQWCINTTQKSLPLKILHSAVQNRACLDYRMGRKGR